MSWCTVAAHRRLGVLALLVGLGAAFATLASAQSKPAAPAKPTGLAPGKAKGTLTVDGKPVMFGYAYAALEANPFDEQKDDIVILLTDKAVPDDVLAGKPLSSAAGAAGLNNTLELAFREDKDPPSPWGFLGRWVVGNRKIGHEVLKDTRLQSSPDFDAKVDPVVVGKDRVEATVYTKGSQESFGHKFEYRIAFNALVKPRVKEAKLDMSKAQRLPSGGGAPGKSYLAFQKAVHSGDIKTLKTFAPPGEPMPPDDQLKKMMEMMAAMAPKDPKILEGFVSADHAVLTVEAVVMGQKQKGTIEMTLQGGVWRTTKESWK